MKKAILFFLTVIFAFQVEGQSVITISDELSVRSDAQYILVGSLKDRFLIFRDLSPKFKVQAFNEHLKLGWEKELELDKKRPEVLDVIASKSDFSVIYKYRQKGRVYLKINKYDPGANLIDSMTIQNLGSTFQLSEFDVLPSEDKKTILVYQLENATKLRALSFKIDQMTLLWDQTFALKDLNVYRDEPQILVDNRGNMYFIMDKDNRKVRWEDHHFEVMQYGSDYTSIETYSLPMSTKLTYDVRFEFDNFNKKLVAGGLYSVDNRGRSDGYFYLNAPPKQADRFLLAFHPFEEKFIAELMDKKEGKEKGLTEVAVQEIVFRRDGGILLIGEQNRESERRVVSGRSFYDTSRKSYIIDYYMEDLFVLSMHPDGNKHWASILHKKQYSQDDDATYSSYFLAKTPKNLRLLFNDEIKAENTVSEYVLSGNGEFERNSVLSTQDQRLRLSFRNAIQVSAREIVIPSERRGRVKLVRIRYE